MAAKHKAKQPTRTYSWIGVKVENYDARVEADINIEAKDSKCAIELDDRDPVYKYITRLTIAGTATYPEVRSDGLLWRDSFPKLYVASFTGQARGP